MEDYTPEYILSLSDEKLIALFEEKRQRTLFEFSEDHKFNKKTFSRFISGHKNRLSFVIAIQRYLLSLLCGKTRDINKETWFLSFNEAFLLLMERFKEPILTLLFIDGDNVGGIFPVLAEKLPHIEGMKWPIHVVCGMSIGGSCPSSVRFISHREWFTLFRSSETVKDAVDVLLCGLAMASHLILPLSTRFIIVSNDMCFSEIATQIKAGGRSCSYFRFRDRASDEEELKLLLDEPSPKVEGYSLLNEKMRELLHKK